MADTPEAAPAAVRVEIFDINLLGDRVQHMRRRMRFVQVCSVLSLAMIIIGGALAAMTGGHLVEYIKAGYGVERARTELAKAEEGQATLDKECRQACEALGPVGALTSIARRRVAWAPKLVALAQALPPTGGVLTIEGQSGDVFYQPPPAEKPALDREGRPVPSTAQKPPAAPTMRFAVLVTPEMGAENLMLLQKRLQGSDAFMKGMSRVRLEAAIEDDWMGQPVSILTGSSTGGEEVKP